MGMRFNFKYGEGDIKLSGLLAEVCIDLGLYDPNGEWGMSLSWSEVRKVVNEINRRWERLENIQHIDLYKVGVLTMWLGLNDPNNEKNEVLFV